MYEDDARFAVTDEDALVRGALACPSCLKTPAVFLAAAERPAECVCGSCGFTWLLWLAPAQAARLRTDPPGGLVVLPCRAPLDADALLRIGCGWRWRARRTRARVAAYLGDAWCEWLAGAAVPYLPVTTDPEHSTSMIEGTTT